MDNYPNSTRLLGYLLFAVGLIPFYLLPIWAGMFSQFYAFDASQVGFLLAADMAGGTIAALAARIWITRVNWRRVLLGALVVTVAANLLCVFIAEFSPLFGLRFLAGIAAGTFMALVYAMFSNVENPDREFSLALALQVAVGAAAIYSAPILLERFGPAGLFAMIGAATIVPVALAGSCPARGSADTSQSPALSSIPWRVWVGLAAITFVFLALTCIWVAMERLGYAEGFGGPAVAAVLSFALLFSFLGAAAPAITSRLAGRRVQVYASYAALCIAIFAVGNEPAVWLFALGLCIYNFFYSFIIPFQTAWIAETDATGANAVLVPVAQGVGVTIGPIIGGYLIAEGNYAAIIIASLLALAASGVFVVLAGDPIRSASD